MTLGLCKCCGRVLEAIQVEDDLLEDSKFRVNVLPEHQAPVKKIYMLQPPKGIPLPPDSELEGGILCPGSWGRGFDLVDESAIPMADVLPDESAELQNN